MRLKSFLQNFVNGWIAEGKNKTAVKIRIKNGSAAEVKKEKPKSPWPILYGVAITFASLILSLIWLGSYPSLWYLMVGGAIIGLIFGSLVAIADVRISAQNLIQTRQKPFGLNFAIVVIPLVSILCIAMISYYLWQQGNIQPELFFPLIGASFGFATGFFLAEGLINRFKGS